MYAFGTGTEIRSRCMASVKAKGGFQTRAELPLRRAASGSRDYFRQIAFGRFTLSRLVCFDESAQHFRNAPGLSGAAPRIERRLGIEDLIDRTGAGRRMPGNLEALQEAVRCL